MDEDEDPLRVAAELWAEQKVSDTICEELEANSSIDSVIESLYQAHCAVQDPGSSDLATGFLGIAGLQARALERRFAAGDGRARRPLDEIGEAIDWEVEHHDFPADARTLFLTMRDDVLADQSDAASKTEPPTDAV